MAVKVLTARQMRDRFVFVLHLDITKMDPLNPTPPPPRWPAHKKARPLNGEKNRLPPRHQTKPKAQGGRARLKFSGEEVGGKALPVGGTRWMRLT